MRTVVRGEESETIPERGDLECLRRAREISRHCERNVSELPEHGKQAAESLDYIIRHFDPPIAVAGAQKQAS